MGKMMWSKLKSLLPNEGKHGKEEEMDSLMRKPNVNEEYTQAFRTKSYIEICDKVKNHLVITTSLDDYSHSSTAASLPPPPIQNPHLFEHLLDPHQETLITSISNTSNSHQFLANYFEISLEACRICETILTNIHLLRNNHRRIKKVLKLITRSPTNSNDHHYLYKKFASFASQRDHLFSTAKFQELRETHVLLLQELTSKCRKMNGRRKMMKLIKRGMASFLVMGCGALVIALLILAMHCMVGLVAAPGLVMCCLMAKKMRRKCNEKWLEKLVVKLDIAAKGVFIMINDFGTMSRIVKRLQDEMERRIYLADICVGKGKNEMMMNVVKEFQVHESWIMEELEDLEKQICLCVLDINRSRRLLVKEMAKC